MYLLGGFKHFLFSPLPGEMIQFDEHIFQPGWNHQLVIPPKWYLIPEQYTFEKVSRLRISNKLPRYIDPIGCSISTHRIHGTDIFTYIFMVDFYGKIM